MLDPFVYTVPTYARLILAGAENVNCTVLDNDAVRAYLGEHGDYDCISPLNNAVSQNLWNWLSTCR